MASRIARIHVAAMSASSAISHRVLASSFLTWAVTKLHGAFKMPRVLLNILSEFWRNSRPAGPSVGYRTVPRVEPEAHLAAGEVERAEASCVLAPDLAGERVHGDVVVA